MEAQTSYGILSDLKIVHVGDSVAMTQESFEEVKKRHIQLGMKLYAEISAEEKSKTTLLTTTEIAQRMKVGKSTVNKWANNGHPRLGYLNFVLIGERFKMSEYDLKELVKKLKI